jgi:hypothetical protein
MKQRVVQAIMHDDLAKMVEKGDIPLQGYLKAVKRGYVQKSDFDEKDGF